MHTIPPPPLHKSPTRGVERVETCGAQEVGWALGGGALDIQLHLPPWELLGLGTRWSDIWGHRAGFDGTLQPVASNDKLCNSFDKMSVAIQIVVPLQIHLLPADNQLETAVWWDQQIRPRPTLRPFLDDCLPFKIRCICDVIFTDAY